MMRIRTVFTYCSLLSNKSSTEAGRCLLSTGPVLGRVPLPPTRFRQLRKVWKLSRLVEIAKRIGGKAGKSSNGQSPTWITGTVPALLTTLNELIGTTGSGPRVIIETEPNMQSGT
jgi:hypothetical protein